MTRSGAIFLLGDVCNFAPPLPYLLVNLKSRKLLFKTGLRFTDGLKGMEKTQKVGETFRVNQSAGRCLQVRNLSF